jgi:hypothetical protein
MVVTSVKTTNHLNVVGLTIPYHPLQLSANGPTGTTRTHGRVSSLLDCYLVVMGIATPSVSILTAHEAKTVVLSRP